jgi:hypothetical protein
MAGSYVQSIRDVVGLDSCSGVATPIVGPDASTEINEQPLDRENHRKYRAAVGKLQYMAAERPDMQFAIKQLSRHLTAPTSSDWQRLKRAVRYLSGTENMALHLETNGKTMETAEAWADADWAGCKASRRSTSCGIICVSGVIITSYSRTQSVVALSSAESELYAQSAAAAEGIMAQGLLMELGSPLDLRPLSDSSSAIAITQRVGLGRMKHFDIRVLHLQDLVKQRKLKVEKRRSEENVSDIGTNLTRQQD